MLEVGMRDQRDRERMAQQQAIQQSKQQRELDAVITRSERKAFWITLVVMGLYLSVWVGVLWTQ